MSATLKIKIAGIKTSWGKLKGRVSVVFWLVLAGLLLMEGLILKSSAGFILNAQKDTPAKIQGKGVRINFKDYDENIKRVESGESFVPTAEAGADPFTGKRTIPVVVPVSSQESQGSSTPSN